MHNSKRHKWLLKNQRPKEGCKFFLGWNGYCKADTPDHSGYCNEHLNATCWHEGCGKQARKTCAIQECDEVECSYHKHYGEAH